MSQIRWTTREWQLIADRLAVNGVVPSEHGWRGRLLEAMRAALPKERWRDAANLSEAKKKLAPLVAVVAKKCILPMPCKEPVAPPLPTITIADFSTEDMVAEIVRRAISTVTEQIKAQVALQMTPQIVATGRPPRAHNPFGVTEPRTEKPRVLIVGPLVGQQRELRGAHEGWLDLAFIESSENPARVAEVGFAADHIILWTNFISHAHQDQAKKLNAKLHYVTGGMSALHNKLRELT